MNGVQAAERLRQMADRVERNTSEEFSGAFLIIPPGDSDPLDGLTISEKPNIPAFWAGLRGQVEIAIAEMEAAANGGPGRGRGFR